MNEAVTSNLESIPEVTLDAEQKELAYQLKARWERPNGKTLIPLTLTRYIVYLHDELAKLRTAPETEAKRGYVGEAPLSYAVLDEIRDRVKSHHEAVEFGSTIDNQYTLDRDYLLGLVPPEWTDRHREPKQCEHLRSELLAEKLTASLPVFEMRKCLDCRLIFRVRSSVKTNGDVP